jgi:succinate dehydrogenase / fumarate reductase flavoprotein subunit
MVREKNKTTDRIMEGDVLVIGAGLAGARAAQKAKELVKGDVILVEKGVIARAGNTISCHIILGPAPKDAIKDWLWEFVDLSEYLCDQEWLQTLMLEHPKRLKELEAWGVPFVRDDKGELVRERCRGMMNVCKGIFFKERFWMDHVRKKLLKDGVKIVNRLMITELLTSDGEYPTSGRVTGAVGFDSVTGEFVTIKAKAVVIATGPMQPIMPFFNATTTGDGQAMAFRAGAEMMSMEFSPALGFAHIIKPPFDIGVGLARFQNHGARFVNAIGERFLEKYFPVRMEQGSSFGQLSQACVRELLDGHGPLYFDMRHWSKELYDVFKLSSPEVIARMEKAGIDIREQPVRFQLLLNYFSAQGHGGIKTNLNGESNVPGLFACGVCANAGSTEVFASTSQANCNVFGYRAGESAGKWALQAGEATVHPEQVDSLRETILRPLGKSGGITPERLYHEVSRKVFPYEYSLYKHENRIKDSLNNMDFIEAKLLPKVTAEDPHTLAKANAARNYLQMCRLFQLSSLERKESRLGHRREEYPYRDNIDWLKRVILKRANGKIMSWTEPLPVERYPFVPERTRVHSNVRFP